MDSMDKQGKMDKSEKVACTKISTTCSWVGFPMLFKPNPIHLIFSAAGHLNTRERKSKMKVDKQGGKKYASIKCRAGM